AHLADHVIVEADGSAGRPFKAPADHEPVIPGCTDLLVAVVGVETVGLPLARENVHRPERVQAITGLEPGQLITSAIVARVLLHPSGIAKGTPSGARTVVLVNKVEDDAQLGTARAIGRLLLAGGVGRVVIGQVRNDPPVVEIMP
ncbi:MAG: selenium cofactor biosynthesis protein YqeC, partial [Chloroflexi bacterium]|nr:selenium cofactor biosynthesis protein YqeC [Chloroflexota bacterium]